jgi:hypothetical protein
MTKQKIISSLYMGIISGFFLGLLLKWIQYVTDSLVYTLLLNVDFIPIIGTIDWSEPIEFLFHVVISIVIAFSFVFIVNFYKISTRIFPMLFISFVLCLPTFFLYFVLSSLAIKEVPDWNDWLAFTYWTISHLIYVGLLPILYNIIVKRADR